MKYTLKTVSADVFSTFAEAAANNTFLQSKAMFTRYQAIHKESYLLALYDASSQIVLAALVMCARRYGPFKIFNCPGGPVGDYHNSAALAAFTTGVSKFLRQKGGILLQISPNIVSRQRDINARVVPHGENNLPVKAALEKLGYRYLGEYQQAKWVYKLSVKNADPPTLYRNFRKGHKLSIRYAKERYHVSIRQLKYHELQLLVDLATESGEYHHFRPPTLAYFQQMYRAFGDHVKFYVTEMPDPTTGQTVITAGGMFVLYGSEITYLYSGSRRQYKKYGGPHLLQWQMIQYAAEHGYAEYNFYGVLPIPSDGVYAFKRGFRGGVVELLGTFMLPLNFFGRRYADRLAPAKNRQVS